MRERGATTKDPNHTKTDERRKQTEKSGAEK
jgi:hypothetical protein